MKIESFGGQRYKLDIELDNRVGVITLSDIYSAVAFADSNYVYRALVEHNRRITRLEGLWKPDLRKQTSGRGRTVVTISGALGQSGAEPSIGIKQTFYVSQDEDYLDEEITLKNLGSSTIRLRDYRFGFSKLLQKPADQGGPGVDIENYRLIAVPFRIQPDGKKHDYFLDDIYHGRYECSVSTSPEIPQQPMVDRKRGRSEAWAWTDGENGLLISKYNPAMIEYSMLDTDISPEGRHLIFGGAGRCLWGEPVEAILLGPSKEVRFGRTRYQFYEGRWRRGAYMFRDSMSDAGHGLPDSYSPPVAWHVIDDVVSASDLDRHLDRAEAIGCESVVIERGWETAPGSLIWDETRLGLLREFIDKAKGKHGISTGLRANGRCASPDFETALRTDSYGSVGYTLASGTVFYEPCYACNRYGEERLRRLVKLADAGITSIALDEFDWRGPCFDTGHGHSVPSIQNAHARAVFDLARGLRTNRPKVSVRMNDPIWPCGVRCLPIYYGHKQDTFDELSAFGFGENPIEELLSGRAISLFYYNLGYALPLQCTVNMDNDNDACLGFWWYASTARRIGIASRNCEGERLDAYRREVAMYKTHRDCYARGEFHAIDEVVHIHVLAEEQRCVVNAFNLTDKPISRRVEIRLNDLGLLGEFEAQGVCHQAVGGKLILSFDLPPLSPSLVVLSPCS